MHSLGSNCPASCCVLLAHQALRGRHDSSGKRPEACFWVKDVALNHPIFRAWLLERGSISVLAKITEFATDIDVRCTQLGL